MATADNASHNIGGFGDSSLQHRATFCIVFQKELSSKTRHFQFNRQNFYSREHNRNTTNTGQQIITIVRQ